MVVSGSVGVITVSSHGIVMVIKAKIQGIDHTMRNISAPNMDG